MSLAGASMELNNGLKCAHEVWEDTKTLWKDSASRAFENDYWIPLESQVHATLQAMEQLAGVLGRAIYECS